MIKTFTPERAAECEAIRATYKPLAAPSWSEKEEPDHWSGDFGDYNAGVFPIGGFELTDGTIVPRMIRWSVGKKIVNEWFGPGDLHVGYGDAATVELAKEAATQAVVADRERRR